MDFSQLRTTNSSVGAGLNQNSPSALVVSFFPLLGYYFSQKLAESSIYVNLINLPPSPSQLPLPTTQVTQTNSLDILHLLGETDYICVFYPSLANSSQLQHLFKHLEKTTAKILLVDHFQGHFFTNHPLLNSVSDSLLRRVYLTHPYGDLRFYSSPDRIHEIMQLSSSGSRLTLPNQGQNLLFPTHIDDLLSPLLKILFSAGAQHPIYFLSSLDQITELDFSYLAQKLSSEFFGKSLTIDFDSRREPIIVPDRSAIAHTQALINFNPSISIEQGTRLTYQSLTNPHPIQTITPPPPMTQLRPLRSQQIEQVINRKKKHLFQILKTPFKTQNLKKSTVAFVVLSLFFAVFIVPPALTLLNAYQGAGLLTSAVSKIEAGDTVKGKQLAQSADNHLRFSRQLLNLTNQIYFFLPDSTFERHQSLLDAGERFSGVLVTTTDAVDQAQNLYLTIVGQKAGDIQDIIPSLDANLRELHTELSLVETSLKDVNFDSRLPYLTPLKKTKDKLPELRSRLELGLSFLDLLPSTINTSTPKTYLLLLQNNTELRPTGGFLTAFASVSLKNGKITEYSVSDIYSADSQLAGKIEPPQPLKAHLEENWYARDSNWSPNFLQSAKQVQWFLNKEINKNYDGVVAIDLSTLQSLLDATGPISSPSLQDSVTSANLYDLLNKRGQVDFSSSSATGQDFLTTVLSLVLDQIKAGKPALPKLAKAIDTSLRQQSIQIQLNDPKLEAFLDTHNWSGSVSNPICPAQFSDVPCTSETYALIEANLGINRANLYLSRRINHSVFINDQGQITHHLEVSYQNNSTDNQWPGGKYKTYSRFYAPLNTKISSVKLGDQSLALDQNISPENPNLIEVGFYYEIPSSSTETLSLDFETQNVLPIQLPEQSLNINWEKQSGSGPTPITLKLNYPKTLRPTLLGTPASIESGVTTFNLPLNKDTSFSVKFTR